MPTLVIHGDDDQVVPLEATGRLAAELIKGATLKVYAGAPEPCEHSTDHACGNGQPCAQPPGVQGLHAQAPGDPGPLVRHSQARARSVR